MQEAFSSIVACERSVTNRAERIGRSRQGREILAYRFGEGELAISLIAGNHADEPAGPRFLAHLVSYLSEQPQESPLLADYSWWIIPHSNPDGRERNSRWQASLKHAADVGSYLKYTVRELPGDDIEFGFPRDSQDAAARPENSAIAEWWRQSGGFELHASLHGMGFAAGPWFLIEREWQERCKTIITRCSAAVQQLGYELHDVERRGEKGFSRITRGFATRPGSESMQQFFLAQGDEATAAKFRPSSMEFVRTLGKDTLTLVSEMPLFITPGVGAELGPPDPCAERWRERIEDWRHRLAAGESESAINSAARNAGLRAMPIHDQMFLQWTFICAGLEQICRLRQ